MKALEIELYRYGTLVFGKVIHQDESLRSNLNSYNADNEFTIASNNNPCLRKNKLYIKGANEKSDDRVFNCNCLDEDEAIALCIRIKHTVNAFNTQYNTETDTKNPSIIKIL